MGDIFAGAAKFTTKTRAMRRRRADGAPEGTKEKSPRGHGSGAAGTLAGAFAEGEKPLAMLAETDIFALTTPRPLD